MEINGAGINTPLQDVELLVKDEAHHGLSICLEETVPNNTFPWKLDVDVRFKNGGRVQLGSFVTVPSSSGPQGQTTGGAFSVRTTPISRVVAVASAPGAVGWWVRCSAAIGAQAQLSLIAGTGYGVMGLLPINADGHPLPALPYRKDRNPALASDRVVIPTRTRLWEFQGIRVGGIGNAFFNGFDATAVPAAGTPADWSALLPPNSNFSVTPPSGAPEEVFNGLVWAISSTADVFTPTNNPELWVRTYFD